MTAVYSSILTSKGKPALFAKILIYATLINIVLNFILILSLLRISNLWAITGAAIATFLSRYFYLFGLARVSKKSLGLKLERPNILKPLTASLVMTFVLIGFKLIVKDMNLISGIIGVLIGIIVYFAVLFLIKGISREDFKLVNSLLKR